MAQFNREHAHTQRGMERNSDSDDELETILLLALHLRRRRHKKTLRSSWVRPIFTRRRQQGEYHNLLQEMRLSDPESHFRYLRMSKERFDSLLAKVSIAINHYKYYSRTDYQYEQVTPLLTHRTYNSSVRASIEPAERLALTLRYLATVK